MKKLKTYWSGALKNLQVFQAWNQRSLANQKIILYGAYFLIGMSLGSLLGLFKHNLIILNSSSIFSWIQSCLNWIISISPNTGFLSDIVAFQGAIIAIAIPLSLEIISRISERYQSGVITKKFSQESEIKLLPILLTIDIIAAIFIKFFTPADSISGYWKIIAWITFIVFIFTIYILYKFFATLRRYITDTNFLLDELFNDMGESLTLQTQNNKVDNQGLKLKQKQFVEALEATGDILVFETKNKKGEEKIKIGLNRIREKMRQFLDMQKSSPKEFERLLLSQDFFDVYDQDKTNATLLLTFNPKKHLVSFTAAVNQLLRIREAALEVNNSEIERFATDHIISLLTDISQIPNNNLLVEQLLQNLAEIRRSIKENQSSSAHLVSTSWYIDIVFNPLFDISYLHLFDRYFFYEIQDIISNEKPSFFKGIVSILKDSGMLKCYPNLPDSASKIVVYEDFLINYNTENYYELEQNYEAINKLESLKKILENVRTIETIENLDSCLVNIDEIEILLKPYFEPFPKIEYQRYQKYEDIGNNIRGIIKLNFKRNNLQSIIFNAGAYCIFKKRFDYIQYLWEYNLPSDADAIRLNHDIYPITVGGLINFGINAIQIASFWEDHHESKIYHQKYLLFLLIREIQRNNKQEIIDNFRFSEALDSRELDNISYSVDSFIELANKLKEDTENLTILGLDINNIESALIPFLESLKPKVEERIKSLLRTKNISSQKVDQFKQDFTDNFDKSTIIRNILSYHGLYEDRIHAGLEIGINPFGIIEVSEKAAFFEEWYLQYSDMGITYGRELAICENLRIIEEIENLCHEIDISQFDAAIDVFKENLGNIIILTINLDMNSLLKNRDNFKSKQQNDCPKIELKGFQGCYTIENFDIPVFTVYDNTGNKRILIFDKSRLGKLVQYSPSNESETEELTGIFHISIQSFSENQEIMNDLLQNPPTWLTDLGDQIKQKEYLEEKVKIEIYEKFQLEKHQDFQGYLIKLPHQDSSN
ncbi:hypothetical protein [Anabaena lutea]|uniref:Uncharacterized protein n=1 Tax=Anabaena lutea FACHB-196 TaxID=2692881 RepID=A0ABR8FP59_9NOST|nr:hypothetical protein [Anabaena lutea]MBD2570685.1 hypothetical protein [Anabaena lutea FACHB-196]